MENVASSRALLSRSTIFERVEGSAMDLILGHAEMIEAKPGQLLLAEGTPGDGLYVILEGEVEVFLPERSVRGARRPTRVRLNRLGPGRCFGEYGVIDDKPCSASVAAVDGGAKLCFVPKPAFRRLLDHHSEIAAAVYGNLLRVLVDRLRQRDQELDLFVLDERR